MTALNVILMVFAIARVATIKTAGQTILYAHYAGMASARNMQMDSLVEARLLAEIHQVIIAGPAMMEVVLHMIICSVMILIPVMSVMIYNAIQV